jgi:hypothetical protein
MSTLTSQSTSASLARQAPYYVEPSHNATERHLGPTDNLGDKAFVFAKAHEHKPWARRWLRMRVYSSRGVA